MQATQIKPHQEYAVTTTPRKGITDLYGMTAWRMRVTKMGVQRYNPTGGEDQEGTYKYDGIRGDKWDGSTWITLDHTFKARDFLMPWREYEAERTRRNDAATKQQEEYAEKQRIHNERLDSLRAEMSGYDLRHTGDSTALGLTAQDGHTLDFTLRDGSHKIIMTVEAAERLMASVATRIYEGIRDAS